MTKKYKNTCFFLFGYFLIVCGIDNRFKLSKPSYLFINSPKPILQHFVIDQKIKMMNITEKPMYVSICCISIAHARNTSIKSNSWVPTTPVLPPRRLNTNLYRHVCKYTNFTCLCNVHPLIY